MAKGETYTVHFYRTKVLDEFRGDRITAREYAVTKYNKHGDEDCVYFVTQSIFGDDCTCKANNRHTCRHRDMVTIFKAANRLGNEWSYNYDEKIEARKWRSTK
jgi:hypothetical protein